MLLFFIIYPFHGQIQRDFSNYNDTLNHLQKTADHVASEAGMKEEPSVKKRLRRIEQLVSEGKQAVKLLEQRVVDAEEGTIPLFKGVFVF